MTIQIKPSDVYRTMTKGDIDRFLHDNHYKIVDFRMIREGDEVLFYNSGKLSVGVATVRFAGYPRFVVENIDNTHIEDFWE